MSLRRLVLLLPLLSAAAHAAPLAAPSLDLPPVQMGSLCGGIQVGDGLAVRGSLAARNPVSAPRAPTWGIAIGDGLAVRGSAALPRLTGRIPVWGASWVSVSGLTYTQRFPTPIDLAAAPLCAPAGLWAEVELLLDGPLILGENTLNLERMTVVLDEPAGEVALWLDLDPSALHGLDADEAERVLTDDARLVVGGGSGD